MRALAEIVTKIFNPTTSVVATILIVIFIQQMPTSQKLLWLVLGFLVAIAPLAVFYLEYKRGSISSFWSPEGKERQKAFLAWVLAAAIYSGLAYNLAAPRLILAVGLVLFILGVVNLLLSATLKISVHSEQVTLFALTAVLAVSVNLIYLVVLIPLVGWARIYLKAHTISEVSLGTLTALLAVYLSFSLFGLVTF